MGNIQTVGPNEAIIASGGCCRPSRKQIIVGGWCWNTFLLTNVQRISLQIMTLNPRCENVQSKQGVPVTITGVVHCKIMSNPEYLPIAAEQFLGKTTEQIKSIVLQTIEGHMRAVIGTQELLDICKNRQELASLVRQSVVQDLIRMGIDILSLTIKDIRDDVEYLSSSGKKTTARVKRDAAIAVAEADQAASKAESQHDQEKEEFKVQIDKAMAQLKHDNEIAIKDVKQNLAESQAEAEKAYDLELSKLQHELREKQMEVESMTYAKRIEIQKLEATRHKIELEMEIELPTRSQIHEMTKEDEAETVKCEKELEAEKYRITEEGKATAKAIKIEGDAEAKGMKIVAEAKKEFNEAAYLYEYIKVIPNIAAELACPLQKFEDIVLISDQSTSSDIAQNGQIKATNVAKMTSSVESTLKSITSDRTTKGLVNTIMQLQNRNNNRK